jgi:hypothetical protein
LNDSAPGAMSDCASSPFIPLACKAQTRATGIIRRADGSVDGADTTTLKPFARIFQ